MTAIVQVVAGGIFVGGVYALIALGMSLIYSINRVINLAQGGFVVLAALIAVRLRNDLHLPVPVVVVAVTVALCGLLVAVERLIIRPAARRGRPVRVLLVTVGLLQVVGGGLLLGWGNQPYTMKPFTGTKPVRIGGASLATQGFWIVGALVLASVGLWLLLQRTELGLSMRATAENPEAAELQGVNVDRLRTLAFVLSGAMAALAGVTVVPLTFLQFDTTAPYAINGFVAAVIGGLGGLRGAVIGGLLLGITEALFGRYTAAAVAQVAAIAVVLVLLLLRPQGISGVAVDVRR